ncbi:MAG: arsenate reductase ArsC [bacterium]|nr:arsenate reductase ArsC [bacterium]
MATIPILFVCVHNSARSQMAEAFMNKLANDKFIAESAGLEPGVLNPLVIEVMKEIGIDISQNQTKSVMDFFKQGKLYRYVITVCDEGAAQKCPLFPGVAKTIHWSFADPAGFTGPWEEKLQKTREVRDQIKAKIETFIKEISAHE